MAPADSKTGHTSRSASAGAVVSRVESNGFERVTEGSVAPRALPGPGGPVGTARARLRSSPFRWRGCTECFPERRGLGEMRERAGTRCKQGVSRVVPATAALLKPQHGIPSRAVGLIVPETDTTPGGSPKLDVSRALRQLLNQPPTSLRDPGEVRSAGRHQQARGHVSPLRSPRGR